MELNREQIIKALDSCTNPNADANCSLHCPFGDINACKQYVMYHALLLIKELTEENERLTRLANLRQRDLDNANDLLFKAEDEKERLKAQKYYIHSDGRIEMIPTVESVRADTVRKMQERLKEAPIKVGLPLFGLQTKDEIEDYANELILQMRDAIDQIAKEMSEGEQ